jgi:hypothetical protein
LVGENKREERRERDEGDIVYELFIFLVPIPIPVPVLSLCSSALNPTKPSSIARPTT